jgi:7-cyano-7-deazaguanine synthase
MARKRVVVLHSGGMDSTVCLYQAASDGHEVLSLGIDYGQRLSVEKLFAERQCASRGIDREVLNVAWKKPTRDIPTDRDVQTIRAGVSSAFLPSRNIVFLSLGHAHACGWGADELHIGLNCVDYSGYPDCTVEFFDSYVAMLAVGSPRGPTLSAPLLRKGKREIATQAKALGLAKTSTWSCYRPQILDGKVAPCGICDACKLHEFAWKAE